MKETPFCVLPWIHSYVDGEGNRGLCCIAKPYENSEEVNKLSLDEYGKWLGSIRGEMLEGGVPRFCVDCGKGKAFEEQRNALNHTLKEEFFQAIDGMSSEEIENQYKPISFDYRIDNTCNLSCTYCSSYLSSKIAWKTKKANLKQHLPVNRPEKYLKELKESVNNNQYGALYFGSGEPFINPLHWELIETLKKDGKESNYKLLYNTNLSVNKYKGESIIDRLSAFKSVGISISLDSTDEIAELLREGLSFEKWKKNFQEFKEAGLLEDTRIYCVLSIPALINLKAFVEFCESIELEVIYTPVIGRAQELLLMTSSLGKKYLDKILATLPAHIKLPDFVYETKELEELPREQLRNAIAYFHLIDKDNGGSQLMNFLQNHPLTKDWYREVEEYAYFDINDLNSYGLLRSEDDDKVNWIEEINFEGEYLEYLLANNIERVMSLKFMKFDQSIFKSVKKYFNQNDKLILKFEQPSRAFLRKQLVKNSIHYEKLKEEIIYFEKSKASLERDYHLKVEQLRPQFNEYFKNSGMIQRMFFFMILLSWYLVPQLVSMREYWIVRQSSST